MIFALDQHQGIRLDIGCGENKQDGFVGMDARELPGVDIVHDLEVFPWPLPEDCCLTIVGSHIIEHIKPWLTLSLFNELWRVMRPGGQLALSTPYAGSPGFWQDPTHCNGFNEATFQYFDPDYPLYQIYKPKPWKLAPGFPVWQVTGNLEVLMSKRELKLKCNRCGFQKEKSGSPCGVIGEGSFYGNHNCPDGEIGNFLEDNSDTEPPPLGIAIAERAGSSEVVG